MSEVQKSWPYLMSVGDGEFACVSDIRANQEETMSRKERKGEAAAVEGE